MNAWCVTTGDGADGNDYIVHGIFSTKEKAEHWCDGYNAAIYRGDGTHYFRDARVEEWEFDPIYEPQPNQKEPITRVKVERGLASVIAGPHQGFHVGIIVTLDDGDCVVELSENDGGQILLVKEEHLRRWSQVQAAGPGRWNKTARK